MQPRFSGTIPGVLVATATVAAGGLYDASPSAASPATRTFSPVRYERDTLVFRPTAIPAKRIRSARLALGRNSRPIDTSRVRIAARDRNLRVRVPRPWRKLVRRPAGSARSASTGGRKFRAESAGGSSCLTRGPARRVPVARASRLAPSGAARRLPKRAELPAACTRTSARPRLVVAFDAKPVVTPAPVITPTLTVTPPAESADPDPDPAGTQTSQPKAPPEPATVSTEPHQNPLGGARFDVSVDSAARRTADAWRSSRTDDAAQMDKIARYVQAEWLGDWNADVEAAVDERVTKLTAAGAFPVLVAYNIPQRDCGGHSAGGTDDAAAYRAWIRSFAAGIGSRRAVVILEPDALAAIDCLSAADQRRRFELLAEAVRVLAGHTGVVTYIDAGHPAWRPASEMASKLSAAGVDMARGFSLNVSNYRWTADPQSYGRAISAAIADKPFVIDTSRNGLGPASDNEWCNAPGRALGPPRTTDTDDPLVDAQLWIKRPGESDGPCNGGGSAGEWWPDYALGLAERSRVER